LKACGVRMSDGLSQMEFRNLLELCDGKEAECGAFVSEVASGGRVGCRADLKMLWESGFPPTTLHRPLPANAASLFPGAPEPGAQPPLELPRSRRAAKRWLRDEAAALSPNVRGRFARDLDPILNFLFDELDDEAVRNQALRDLHVRLRNEETKIF